MEVQKYMEQFSSLFFLSAIFLEYKIDTRCKREK